MTLQTYLSDYLGDLYTQLGYSASSLDNVIVDTLSTYGVSTEEEAIDIDKFYKLGIYFLWKKVYRESLFNVDYSADGVNLKNSQITDNAKEQLRLATSDVMEWLPNNRVKFYQKHPECHFNEFSLNYRRW